MWLGVRESGCLDQFNSRRCNINDDLFCKSAPDSCSGRLAHSAMSPHLLAKCAAGKPDSLPTGKPADNLAGTKGGRLYAWRPCKVSLHGFASFSCHQKKSPGSVCSWAACRILVGLD